MDLLPFFSEEAVKKSFADYKSARQDSFDSNEFKIPTGADGVDYRDFEKNLDINASAISRRLLSGKYYFYPLLEKKILKPFKDGKRPKKLTDSNFRTLSVSTIRDAVVQRLLYQIVYPVLDRKFSKPSVKYTSFAYRKGFSAPMAAVRIHEYIKSGYVVAIDADLEKYFDTIDHNILYEKIERELKGLPEINNLLRRFIHTDRIKVDDYRREKEYKLNPKSYFKRNTPKRTVRERGIPQGGMLSGLLANLYLADFDYWVVNKLKKDFDLRYLRYADDFVILLKDIDNAEEIKRRICEEMVKINLKLNIDKTKVIEISKEDLIFLGFAINSRRIGVSPGNKRKYRDRIEKILKQLDVSKWEHLDHRDFALRVTSRLGYKVRGVRGEICKVCNRQLSPSRNWVAFFSASTDVKDFRELDKWTRVKVYNFVRKKRKNSVCRKDIWDGYASLEREYYRIKNTKFCKCETAVLPETEGTEV